MIQDARRLEPARIGKQERREAHLGALVDALESGTAVECAPLTTADSIHLEAVRCASASKVRARRDRRGGHENSQEGCAYHYPSHG